MAGDGARIAIVGAGIAGLTAAHVLARSGVTATVFECSGRVGGRMHSHGGGYWAEGQRSEWCGEVIDTAHITIRALAQEFGLALTDLLAAEPASASETFFLDGRRYPHEQADADFRPVRDAVERDRCAAGETTWSAATEAGIELDEMSVHDWIETRVPGGHGAPLGRLLDVAYASEYAADTTDQSALNLVHMLGHQPESTRFSVLGESDERFRIEGGSEQLPLAIADALPEPVRLGWRLDAVRTLADGRIRMVFDAAGTRREIGVDHALLALPFAVLRTLDCDEAGFDKRKRAVIEELGAGRSAKLALQFDERCWNARGPRGGGGTSFADTGGGTSFADTGCMATWEATRGQPGAAGILVSFIGGSPAGAFELPEPFCDAGDDAAVERHARSLLARLEPVFPGVTERWNGRAALSVPMIDPSLRCSYPYYRVGQYHRFAGYERVRAGRIHFAGDHCSLDFQGFMEGAAAEGRRAAREILAGA